MIPDSKKELWEEVFQYYASYDAYIQDIPKKKDIYSNIHIPEKVFNYLYDNLYLLGALRDWNLTPKQLLAIGIAKYPEQFYKCYKPEEYIINLNDSLIRSCSYNKKKSNNLWIN